VKDIKGKCHIFRTSSWGKPCKVSLFTIIVHLFISFNVL